MRFRRWVSGALIGVLGCIGVPALAATSTPAITGMSLSAESLAPGAALSVTVSTTQATWWRFDLMSACSSASVRSFNGYSASPTFSAQWDGVDASGVALAPGAWRIRMTLVDVAGTAVAASVDQAFTITGDDAAICASVRRSAATDVLAQGLADLRTDTTTSVIITTAEDAGYAAIASSYAHRYRVPLLLLPRDASATTIASTLAKRPRKAVLVGGVDAVSSAFESTLRAKKLTVVRLSGTDRAATAALIATRIKPTESGTAVFAPLGGDASTVALAAAYANAAGLPLLAASTTLSQATIDAVRTLRIVGGIALGDSAALPDATLGRLPSVTRVIGKDLASTSFALARATQSMAGALYIERATAVDVPALIARAARGESVLVIAEGDVSTNLRAWLAARTDVAGLTVSPRVSRDTAVLLGRLVADRGVASALPALAMQPMPAVAVPAQFTVSGSGFGHGVGMSQWGAYGMAKESHTATDILQHYFTGSLVAPVNDNVDINVSLHSHVQSASFRLEKLADAMSTLEVTAADGSVYTLAVGDVVSVKYAGGRIAVALAPSTGIESFTTSALTMRWAGNRDVGTATGGPAVLRVAGPGLSVESGSRYRYGIVQVTVAKAGVGVAGLQVNNILRLHDEYLYGIAEVSSSWPAATLQAQVITARSYAYKKVKAGIRSACACNVYDDPSDQNFTGYAKLAEGNGAGAKWKAAVDGTLVTATQGLALTVAGQVVSAYYSAATGGRTQNNEDVWGGTPLSYTRSVDDPWSLTYASSSVSRWTPRSFSQARVAAAFGAPDVVSLDFSLRQASGAVKTVTATSSDGTRFPLPIATFKSRLNSGLSDGEVLAKGLPSSWVWRVDTDVPTISAAAAAQQVSSGTTSINAGLPSATSPTVVIVQADTVTSDGPAVLALAAAFAGAQRAGLLVNTSSGLDAALKSDLQRRKATSVAFVGPVPTALTAAVTALKISSTRYTAATPPALSAQLAAALKSTNGAGIVVVAQRDFASHALAVSLAARTRVPLLMVDAGTLAPEVSAFLLKAAPKTTTVVGSADAVPDALVAGLGTTRRLATSDARTASLIVASQAFDTATPAVVVSNVLAPQTSLVIAAATALPLYLVDVPVAPVPVTPATSTVTSADTSVAATASASAATAAAPVTLPAELLGLTNRLPAFTLVFRVSIGADAIRGLRNA